LESYFTQFFPQKIIYHLSSEHAKYVKFERREIFQDNEELQFQLMVMPSACHIISILGMNDSIHFENLSQGALHVDFIHGFVKYVTLFLIPPNNNMMIIVDSMTKMNHIWRNPTCLHVESIINCQIQLARWILS
jgi:hypothetical protein